MVTMVGGGLSCDREAVLGMLFIKPSQRSCELGTRTKFFFWMGKPRPKEPKSFAPVKQQEAQLGLCQGLPSTLFSGVCTETIPTRVFLARISSVKYAFDSLHGSRLLLVACDPKNIFSGFSQPCWTNHFSFILFTFSWGYLQFYEQNPIIVPQRIPGLVRAGVEHRIIFTLPSLPSPHDIFLDWSFAFCLLQNVVKAAGGQEVNGSWEKHFGRQVNEVIVLEIAKWG